MNKIDLIIENIEYAKIIRERAHQDELLEEALAAARELKALQPVAAIHSFVGGGKHIFYLTVSKEKKHENDILLYALDEVTK
jgi:hypothetical protein